MFTRISLPTNYRLTIENMLDSLLADKADEVNTVDRRTMVPLVTARPRNYVRTTCCGIPASLRDWQGTRWRSGWGTALQTVRLRVRFPMVSLDFFIDIIIPVALWPWGRLSLQQKWVPGIFPGGKGGRCVGLTTLPPSCADCLKIWTPQPSGTLRACQILEWDCFTLGTGAIHGGQSLQLVLYPETSRYTIRTRKNDNFSPPT
jgi:hypothetical protein